MFIIAIVFENVFQVIEFLFHMIIVWNPNCTSHHSFNDAKFFRSVVTRLNMEIPISKCLLTINLVSQWSIIFLWDKDVKKWDDVVFLYFHGKFYGLSLHVQVVFEPIWFLSTMRSYYVGVINKSFMDLGLKRIGINRL